ncbi:TPA: hypothetical protein QCK30_003880 [Enterobacter sichuanensis]|uniref:hypothetical protein n=1 Tax=Enterobacter sichuanensis TaxID=2071710 RepID=UPI0011D0B390|nr:hypothetical protein [Enterobacter sichuanensis]HDR2845371.1 hypothetical protein [Enterobacter sichuanensis]
MSIVLYLHLCNVAGINPQFKTNVKRLKCFQEFADIAPYQALLLSAVTGMRFRMLKFDSILADSQPQKLIHCKGATDFTLNNSSCMKAATQRILRSVHQYVTEVSEDKLALPV